MNNIISESFEFNKWKDCFAYYKKLLNEKVPNLRLIISTHWATSGYWIENKTEPVDASVDFEYKDKDALKLMERVEKEIKVAKKNRRSPRFTT